MMNEIDYPELMKQFSGHWVLIVKNKVKFSDKSFDIVYKKAESMNLDKSDCIIQFVDTGDAVFF